MDKAEALAFIGLKEPISEEAVRDKYTERFNYFQMLYSNAPSKVVEQIQQQNLQKLNQVKKMLLEELAAKKKDFDKKYVNPLPKPKPEAEKTGEKPVVGWLIVHTENKKTETFDLYEGVNYIGRKKKDDKANSILIEDDPFVSRTHAFIKCKEAGGELQYVLYDGDGSKQSANGVFLNGNDRRIKECCYLKENDTIQIGTTKLVFKVKKDHRGISGEIEEIMRTDFIRTVDIHK
jgi:pSer/pThr/pTyr-binding forkhead associated (FHA) protein